MGIIHDIFHRANLKSMPHKAPDIASDDRTLLAWLRTHMANERTFLAWSRTSISLLAFGFVIEKFDLFMKRLIFLSGGTLHSSHGHEGVYLSLFCFVLAGVMILVSGIRFLSARRHINGGEATFSVLPDVLVVISVIIIIIMTLWLTFNQISAIL